MHATEKKKIKAVSSAPDCSRPLLTPANNLFSARIVLCSSTLARIVMSAARRPRKTQRADRLQWSLDPSAPLASSTAASAAFTLQLISPTATAAASKLVIAEFFNDEAAAEASHWQECSIHRYLTQSFTPDDRKLYMRQRTSTPSLARAEEVCQLRAFERQRSKNESQYHLLCFESYDGTLELAVDRSSSSFSAASAASSNSSSSLLPPASSSSTSARRDALRTSLFWCGDADGRADSHAMRSKSSAFILHCLRCLEAHHRHEVLLGDIQPAHLFFTNEQAGRPVFGDYSQATCMNHPINEYSKIKSNTDRRKWQQEDLPASSSGSSSGGEQQRRDYWLTPVSTRWFEPPEALARAAASSDSKLPPYLVRRPTLAATETPSTFVAVVAQLEACLNREVMAGLVQSLKGVRGPATIGSPRYRAPEATAAGELSGFCCEASDVYSMCVTLIDILCGHDRHAPLVDIDSETSFHEECSRQFDEDEPWTHAKWLNLGAPAIIDANVASFFREAMKSVCVHWELSELIDQVQCSDATRNRDQLRFVAAAAAKAPPLYATCELLSQSETSMIFSISPRATIVEEQPLRPTLIAKRFPLSRSNSRQYQSNLADRLKARMPSADHSTFVRQRLRPDERLERAIANDLFTRLDNRRDEPRVKPPRAKPRVSGQHWLTDAERREHALGVMRKEVTFFRYYSGSLQDALTHSDVTLQLRRDWFWQPIGRRMQGAGDADAMCRKALRFVLHCLQGLAAHHACGVLLGDIKPSNLFYDRPGSNEQQGSAPAAAAAALADSSFNLECRPFWGDYDHATDMRSPEWGSHVRIISQAQQRYGGYADKDLRSQQAAEAETAGELLGLLTQSIGTWPYQAPETFTPPYARSVVALTGEFHSRSDAYALALTLLEVCVGRPFATASTLLWPSVERQAFTNTGFNQALQRSHVQPLLAFSQFAAQNDSCDQLKAINWNRQPLALLPLPVIKQLLQLLHRDRNKRPTIAAVIATILQHLSLEACLVQFESDVDDHDCLE